MMDLEAVRAALRAQEPTGLLEQPEGQWLDAKSVPYELREPRAVEELAKDVAAFANGGGGVLVLGVGTRDEYGEEILDTVIPVDRASVDLDRFRKLIREHITPAPRGVEVGWSDDHRGARVVYIDVPAQAANVLFVVAAPVGKPGTPRTDTVAVPVRDGDSTHWLLRTDIQRLLSAGVAASGMPTAQALTELLRDAMSQARGDTVPAALRIGQGLPDRERELREAYEHLVDVGLGQPAGEAYTYGPAALQDFRPVQEGAPGWVLCLVAGQAPGAISAPVWQAIVAVGRRAVGEDPLASVGHPVPPRGAQGPWVVEAGARAVELDGGSWGAGHMLCSDDGQWQWQPTPRFSLHQGRSAKNWTTGQTPQLRLRALVDLPWANTSTLEITTARRQHLVQNLPNSKLAGAATNISRRRGGNLPAAHWAPGLWGNSLHCASYACTITAPDGRPAVTAALTITLPTAMESSVVACADVLIEDAFAWGSALSPDLGTQLTLDEVHDLLLNAWETAAELLPDAVGVPDRMWWAAPPTTELRLSCEQPAQTGAQPALASFIDLQPLGPTDRGSRAEMAVTITAAPALERKRRQDLTRRALDYMAQAYGHVHGEANLP